MTEQELIEALANKEHDSWARWMAYLFSKCDPLPDGSLVIPFPYIVHWRRQIETPYAGLSDKEQQSDRNEVAHILPIIKEYTHATTNEQFTTGEGFCPSIKRIEFLD